MSKRTNDPRFSAMHSAPLFQKLRKEKFKTKVDDRFKKVLTDERFSAVPAVDSRGKKKKKNAKDELREFYEIEEDNTVDTSVPPSKPEKGKKTNKESMETRLDYLNKLARGEISDSSDSNEDSASDSDSDVSDEVSVASEASYDPLQIPGDEKVVSENVDNVKRLSIQNCDWDNVKALDLLVMLQSFCPTGGKVVSVTVYPSDFGLARMQEEELHGPVGIWSKEVQSESGASEEEEDAESSNGASSNAESRDGSEDGSEEMSDASAVYDSDAFEQAEGEGDFVRPSGVRGIVFSKQPATASKQQEKAAADTLALREYELSKLRYYFAIAEFDRAATADKVYTELDGIEFEHSSMALDFRYVPDEISFHEREVRDECHDMPAIGTYTPPEFIIQALQHTNVECTWDQGERSRAAKLTNSSLWKKLQDSELQQYIASSESEDEEVEDKRSNIRKLLLGDAADDSDDMYGSDDREQHDDFFMRDDEDETGDVKLREEKDVDKVMSFVPKEKAVKSLDEETPAEARLRKKQERKAKKNAVTAAESESAENDPHHRNMSTELQLMFAGESDSENKDYDMRQIMKDAKDKKKKNKKKNKGGATIEDNFAIDLQDSRFNRLEQDPNFGIDPTSADYKHTKGMETLLETLHEKRERKRNRDEAQVTSEEANIDVEQSVTSLADKLKKKFSSKSKKAKI